VQIDVLDYNKRKDGQLKDMFDFFNNPEQYESNFLRFALVADMMIAGHFHNAAAPDFFSSEDTRHTDFNLRVIADISCDIDHPIPSTLRSSTIADPFYGYDRTNQAEGDFMNMENIAVMAVDNLPASLPKDSSEGFGEMFLEHVIPAFFDGDKNEILKRAKITENGKLTERFSYLQNFVDGLE
jgi:alanine dehydrogenase